MDSNVDYSKINVFGPRNKNAKERLIAFKQEIDPIRAILPNSCSMYSWVGILTFLTLLLILLPGILGGIYSMFTVNIWAGLGMVVITLVSCIIPIYINAHLKKGCEAITVIKEYKDFLAAGNTSA